MKCMVCGFLSVLRHATDQITAPEPHVLLFRRAKNFDAQLAQQQLYEQQQQQYANAKAAGTRNGRKK